MFVATTSLAESSELTPTLPEIPRAPRGYSFSGGIGEWLSRAPARIDEQPEGTVSLWFATARRGLVIAGQVEGGTPRFPGSGETLREGDHVEIALALTPEIELPPIGWGHQFGDLTLDEKPCREQFGPDPDAAKREEILFCESWEKGQKKHRERLRHFFLRHWFLAPDPGWQGFVLESAATPAFAGLEISARESLERLRPRGRPLIYGRPWPKGAEKSGYYFEVEIPWEVMPPTQSLDLERIFLGVRVHRAGGAGTVDDGDVDLPAYDSAAGWTEYALEEPRRFQLSRCHAPRGPWFEPAAESLVEKAFRLVNQAGGYWYEARGLSPGVEEIRYTFRELASGELICGPELAIYRDGRRIPARLVQGSQDVPLMLPEDFEVRSAEDGVDLLISPRTFYSAFGSGQCGACPRFSASLYHVDLTGEVSRLFQLYQVVDGVRLQDGDIHVAEDWSSFTLFLLEEEHFPAWKKTVFCLRDGHYAECGSELGEPPQPRRLRPAADFDR